MAKITIDDPSAFVLLFSEKYLDRGFGSMNKSELESLFFYLLKRCGSIKDKSNFDISLDLQIPVEKVRKLAYESELRYGSHNEAESSLIQTLIDSYIDISDKKKIQFAIEDKFVQTLLNAKLKSIGHFADTSFNSEIVTLSSRALGDLLYEYYDKEAQKILEDEIREKTGKSFKDVLCSLLSVGANVVTILSSCQSGVSGVELFLNTVK